MKDPLKNEGIIDYEIKGKGLSGTVIINAKGASRMNALLNESGIEGDR